VGKGEVGVLFGLGDQAEGDANVGGEKVGGGGLGRNLDGRIAELRIGPAPAP